MPHLNINNKIKCASFPDARDCFLQFVGYKPKAKKFMKQKSSKKTRKYLKRLGRVIS